MEFYQTAYRFLRRSGLRISKGFLQNRMQSHPDYPYLVSLTDTLDEMGIQYAAVVADKDHLYELSYPVLAHVNTQEKNTFVEVSKPERLFPDRVADQFDRICVYIKKDAAVYHTEHEEWYKKETRSNTILTWSLIVIVAVMVGATAFHFTLLMSLLQGLNLAGITLCGLIVAYNMGKSNVVTEQLCGANGGKECEKVLHHKNAKWRGIGLDDAGLIYFMGLSLFIFVVSFSTGQFLSSLNILMIIVGMACLSSLGSILYQWKIIKSWCKMCLLVSGILWLQAFVLYMLANPSPANLSSSFYLMAVLIVSFLIPALIWANIKPLLLTINGLVQKEINGLKFKRNPEVFLSLLRNQRKVDTAFWEKEIVLGSPDAPIQIMVASNPFCAPCVNAHKQLDNLLKLYPTKICICTRFTVHNVNVIDKKLAAVSSILKSYISGNRHAVEEWFVQMNLEKFNQYQFTEVDEYSVNVILQRHEGWTKHAMITHTPTIFMNGYELPKQYGITDLNSMIDLILESITPFSVVANTEK